MLSDDDKRVIDEQIAARLEAESIVAIFRDSMDERAKEELADAISRFMYDRQKKLARPQNTYTPRYLLAGQDINNRTYNAFDPQDVVGHAGPTLPRVVNLDTGFQARLSASDPQQLDIKANVGAGADCMFDYLVSSCFASLTGFTEGQSFTSLSGCTFKGYSTINGAATAIGAAAANATLFICDGTYLEDVLFPGPANKAVTVIGASRDGVTVTGQASGGIAFGWTSATTTMRLHNLSVTAHASASAKALGPSGITNVLPGSLHNVSLSSGSNAAGIAFNPGSVTAPLAWRVEDTSFGGSGIGICDGSGGDSSATWGNVVLVDCLISAPVGVRMVNDSGFHMSGGTFSGAVGIQNNSSSASRDVYCVNVTFNCTTAGVQCSSSGGLDYSAWLACHFTNCTRGFDWGSLANVARQNRIEGCEFGTDTATDIGIDDTSGALRYSVITGNTFGKITQPGPGYNANNEIIGVDTTDNQVAHNTTDSGATLPDTHTVTLAGTYAPIGSAFVTIGADATLTAERALALTPADGEHTFTDGGSSVTLVGVAASTSQKGHAQFDSTAPASVAATAAAGASAVIADRAHVHALGIGTTRGDIIAWNSTPAPARVALGASGTLLRSDGTDAAWATPAAAGLVTAEHHTLAAQVDVTVASTTVPYQVIGPMAAAGTITAVEAKSAENKTNGATSAIFDIHKIATASKNTDGQGTTIFTTQGNRPTISNGNMLSTTTLPDVTTFAAGDWFAIYCDQSGTSLTVATVSMTFTHP